MQDGPPSWTEAARERYEYVASLLLRDLPPPARIVELGSAPGDQIAALAHLGYEATSVDLGVASDAWGGHQQGRMHELLRESGVTHVEWNLEDTPYPFADASFEAVLMTEVFEHLREYPLRALEEARRLLREGGRLYFTTPNAAYLVRRLSLLAGRSVHTSLADWIGGEVHARHAREYTFAEIHELMRLAGLRVLSSRSPHFYISSGRTGLGARIGKRALGRLARSLKTLGPSIAIVAIRDTATR